MGVDRRGRGSGGPDPRPPPPWQNKKLSFRERRVLDLRPRGCGFEPHRRHCVVSLSKNINPSLVLGHPRKTRPFITERLLMGRKESNLITSCHLFHRRKTGTNLPREAIRPPARRRCLDLTVELYFFIFVFACRRFLELINL